MKRPFVPIFLAALLVLNLVHGLGVGEGALVGVVCVGVVGAVVAFYLEKYSFAYVLIGIGIVFLIGVRFVGAKDEFTRLEAVEVPIGEYVTLYGELTQFPDVRVDHSVIFVRAERVEYARKERAVDFSVRVRVNGDLSSFYRGDRVEIALQLSRPRYASNFYDGGLEDYRLLQGNHFAGISKSVGMVRRIGAAGFFWRFIGRWRNAIRGVIEDKYGRRDRESANDANDGTHGKYGNYKSEEAEAELNEKGVFWQAVLIGERGKLSVLQKEALIGAGVFHLLAISGAHIGIIVLFSLLVLKLCRVPDIYRYGVTAVLLLLFLALSGFKVSAERAVIMALLIFIARAFFQNFDVYNIIAFAGLFMLMKNPLQFLDAGFILTLFLTAAIVAGRGVFLPLFNKVFLVFPKADDPIWETEGVETGNRKRRRKGASDLPVDPEDEIDESFSARALNTVYRYFGELVCANLSASIVALPLSLFYFKRYTFSGFFAGLVLLPLTALITAGGVLLIVLAPLSAAVARVWLDLFDPLMNLFFAITRFFAFKWESLTIFRASPSVVLVVAVMVLFYICSVVKTPKRQTLKRLFPRPALMAGVLLSLLLLGMVVPFFRYSPGHLEVFYLDVGQGDAQVVVFPGGDALLIDGGGSYYSDFQVGRNIVLPFLLQKRIRVKYVAVSHFHPDHVKGITEIIHILKPDELWVSADARGETHYSRLMERCKRMGGMEIKTIRAPFKREIGGCEVRVLFPETVIQQVHVRNDHSQVMSVSDAYRTFLFTGDIERDVEARLSEEKCRQLRAQVMKVPHHGSRTSSTREFLECVRPEWAIFSYGYKNRFRFPHPEAMRNYEALGIKHLSTAQSGGIRALSLPDGIRFETSRK